MSLFGYFIPTAWSPFALSFFLKLDPKKAVAATLVEQSKEPQEDETHAS